MRGVLIAMLCVAFLLAALIAALADLVPIAVLFIVIAILLLVLLAALFSRPAPTPPGTPATIPDALPPAALATALQLRLAGTPADGATATAAGTLAAVIWVDSGDELLVHLDSLRVRFVDRFAVVALDVETDETGRTTMVLPFGLGDAADPAGLVAVADEVPRGNARIAARWGAVLRQAMWSALLSLASDHAAERSKSPRGMAIDAGQLKLSAGATLRIGAAP